jgi:AcrR family transcriptional regulator/predicted DNA-binding transcriptional regulator AlpA
MGKLSRHTEKSSRRIRITELAELSGVSKSTIHHYLKMGILHPPKKLGLSLSVYDWTHLSKLKRIRELRENQKLPLPKIKEIISDENLNTALAHREDEAESLIRALEDEKRIIRARKSEIKRIEIIDAAIALFSKNGYEKTTIEAIADSLHMAKGTVYLYFETKEELFMECIERLTVVAVPEEAWEEIRKEQNALRRLKKRGFAFHKAFPNYKGILTMTKTVLGGYNRKLDEKAKKTLSLMTRPIAKDLRRGTSDRLFRKIDDELTAHFILALGEALGCRLMMDSRYTIEEGMKIMFDFITHGIMKDVSPETPKFEPVSPSGEVTDLKGVMTMVGNIRFGTSSYLPVKIGEAEVRINPNKLKRIGFQQQESTFWAEITGMEGKTERVEVDGTLTLSGEVPLGGFVIELKNVTSILFGNEKPQRPQVDNTGEIKP